MTRLLASLLGLPDRLTRLSWSPDHTRFVRLLGEWDLVVIGALDSEGLDAETLTPEQLLQETERVLQVRKEQEGFQPFVYLRSDLQCLPVFSTMKMAECFLGEYSKARNRVFPFDVATIRGSALLPSFLLCDMVVLNDSTRHEFVLSADDVELFRQIWS